MYNRNAGPLGEWKDWVAELKAAKGPYKAAISGDRVNN